MQLDQLTFTRFIAAMTVIFFHYGQTIFPANIPFLHENIIAGPIAVGYFYILSGFIMAIAYYESNQSKRLKFNRGKYWIARFARIYPVYVIALLVVAAAKIKTLNQDWETLPLHLSLLQSWIPGYPITLNIPGWSLSVEAFFYLCFPFLLLWIYKKGIKPFLVSAITLWLITQVILLMNINSVTYAPKSLLHDLIYYNPMMHLNQFLLGIASGIYLKNNQHRKTFETNNEIFLISALVALFTIIWGRHHLEALLGIKLAFTNGLLAPLFIISILLFATHKGLASRIFKFPFFILLGEASYSLYILQMPVYGVYSKIIAPRLHVSDTLHFYLFLVLLIIVSIASFKLFETPMRKLINKALS